MPTSVWQAVFITGHGFWTSVENAVVGPFIAIISFVCSIGNVPLAAALWSGGISFGGVIAFIFADLIAFPLLLIYRRYYGTRLMLRMLVVFWALMSTAGLLTELLFRAAGLVPTMRPTTIAPAHFSWNYTTYLNLIFLVLFGVLYWLYRNRDRLGGGDRYARDPVCGMQVEKAHAPAPRRARRRRAHYFCSDRCAERFDADGAVTDGRTREAGVAAGERAEARARGRPTVSRSAPSPFTSAPIFPISRSCSATSGSRVLPSAAASSSGVGGRSAVWAAAASSISSTFVASVTSASGPPDPVLDPSLMVPPLS